MPSGPETTGTSAGSRSLSLSAVLLLACGSGAGGARGELHEKEQATEIAGQHQETRADATRAAPAAAMAAETSLGVVDRGIFSDLDPKVQIALPAGLTRDQVSALIEPGHRVLVLYREGWPIKVYPLGGEEEVKVGQVALALRPGDRAELAPLLAEDRIRTLGSRELAPPGDADRDGIPDPLDVLLGGKKVVLDAAPYGGGYIEIDYPNGDIPRGQGVCTDVVIRAGRNAGFDLQSALQRDLRAARAAYPMVKRPNASIDHRRVKTILPFFLRRWDRRKVELTAADDPLRPGDVVFFDTFPQKPGPDHIGIVSDTVGPSGMPMVINSWTDGFRTSEMDLLSFVPVTHRFRFPSQ
jgi:uncharacterized protein YijF (DUF1287 family)